jgi:hypothetical protein
MTASLRGMVHEVGLQVACHSRCPSTAPANKTDAAARQMFDRRDCHVGGKAPCYDLALVERNEEDAAHFLWPRFAAAMASRALP